MNTEGNKKVQEVIEHLCDELLRAKNIMKEIELANAIAKLVGSLATKKNEDYNTTGDTTWQDHSQYHSIIPKHGKNAEKVTSNQSMDYVRDA